MPSNDQQRKDQQTDQTSSQHLPANSRHAVEPSGPKGDNPATAGPGPTQSPIQHARKPLRPHQSLRAGGCQHNPWHYKRKV